MRSPSQERTEFSRGPIGGDQVDLLSKEIGAVPRMLETGTPRGRDLHRGSISATAFGNGLSLHTVDVIDLEDFTTEILMPASLSICFLLNGGVAMGSDEEQFTLGSVDGATAAPEGGYFSLAQPGKFWRKAEKGRRLRAAVVVVRPEWLSDRGAESSTVAEALNSRPTSHGSWNLSPQEILLAEQLLQPPQFEPFLHNLLLESRTMEAVGAALTVIGAKQRDGLHSLRQRERERLEAMKTFVESNAALGLTLTEMARHFGVDVKILQRDFRLAFGTTIFNYLKEYRLERAREALLLQGISVQEAAHVAGYLTPSNFATAFKKRYGISPKQVRLG